MNSSPERKNPEADKAEFNQLFEELTGIKPSEGQTGPDGWLFIPKQANLGQKDGEKRSRLEQLSGPNGWRNNLTEDGNDYNGWWIRPIGN